jgi:hypothetical protein
MPTRMWQVIIRSGGVGERLKPAALKNNLSTVVGGGPATALGMLRCAISPLSAIHCSEMILPVLHPATGEVVGTIDVESDRPNAFSPRDKDFLEDCANVTLALWTESPQ